MKHAIIIVAYLAFLLVLILFIGDSSYVDGRFHMNRPGFAFFTAILLGGISISSTKD